MKPLVKKILEAGLVDKHAARMFEQWGQLEPGAADLVGQKKVTEKTLEDFAEDIEALLEDEHEVKETRLDVQVRPPVDLFCPASGIFSAVEDEMGRYIISTKVLLNRGDQIFHSLDGLHYLDHQRRKDLPCWTVLEVESLFQGDKLVAYQVTVDKPE